MKYLSAIFGLLLPMSQAGADVLVFAPLVAGQNEQVGTVNVSADGSLNVAFVTAGQWCVTEAHLHVADDAADVPQKNGNPIPGKFEYKTEAPLCDQVVQFTVPIPANDGSIVVAAHAIVASPAEQTCELLWQIGDDDPVTGIEGDPAISDEFQQDPIGSEIFYDVGASTAANDWFKAFVPPNFFDPNFTRIAHIRYDAIMPNDPLVTALIPLAP